MGKIIMKNSQKSDKTGSRKYFIHFDILDRENNTFC